MNLSYVATHIHAHFCDGYWAHFMDILQEIKHEYMHTCSLRGHARSFYGPFTKSEHEYTHAIPPPILKTIRKKV